MKLLLDTHAFLWFTADSNKLSSAAKKLIEDPANEKLLSSVVGWKIAIKYSIGKLNLSVPVENLLGTALADSHWKLFHFDVPAIATVSTLPFHHRDPFDRMLVAQAQVSQLPIVSCDEQFDAYGVKRLW